MQRLTSAFANRILKNLEYDKEYWLNREACSSTYTVGINEDPIIPEYNYFDVASKIDEIDRKICAIKHALNLSNTTAKVKIGEAEMSIDMILIRMTQLNKRKTILNCLRKQLPKTREPQRGYGQRNAGPEYKCINYNLDQVKNEYERISKEILEMQTALDYYNQTAEFEVEM